jgi:hypothetical protein
MEQMKVAISKDYLEKLRRIAEKHKRKMNKQIEYWIDENIDK